MPAGESTPPTPGAGAAGPGRRLMAGLRRSDLAAFTVVRRAARPAAAVRLVKGFSSLGEHAACWLALGAGGTALDVARRPRWKRATGGVAGAYLLNVALKGAVGRPRPQVPGLAPLIATPTQLSFPSAHATSGFTAARAYSALLPAGPLYAMAGALGLSRIYLGVHYPSDVLAGAALGLLLGSAAR